MSCERTSRILAVRTNTRKRTMKPLSVVVGNTVMRHKRWLFHKHPTINSTRSVNMLITTNVHSAHKHTHTHTHKKTTTLDGHYRTQHINTSNLKAPPKIAQELVLEFPKIRSRDIKGCPWSDKRRSARLRRPQAAKGQWHYASMLISELRAVPVNGLFGG